MAADEHMALFVDDDEEEDEATKVSKFVRPPPPPADRAPKASLVVVYVPLDLSTAAADLGRRKVIDGSVIIGRNDGSGLRLDQDDISRSHAEVWLRDDRFFVRDSKSRNGTFVNDTLLRAGEERALVDGDRIQVGLTILKFIQSETEDKFHEVIYKIKVEDALTRIHNKRFLVEYLEREISRAVRHRSALSLTMFDIDHFKRINDTWGHLAGDTVLRELATLVKSLARMEDCFARYGGEEFAFVQPEVGLAGATILAEKIRSCVEAHSFVWEGHPIPVTVSLGTAEMNEGEAELTQFIKRADERLYEAKRGGRNRVVAR